MNQDDYRADILGLSVFWAIMLLAVVSIGISHNNPMIERLGLTGLFFGALAFCLSIAFNINGLPAVQSAGRALMCLSFVFGLLAYLLAVTK